MTRVTCINSLSRCRAVVYYLRNVLQIFKRNAYQLTIIVKRNKTDCEANAQHGRAIMHEALTQEQICLISGSTCTDSFEIVTYYIRCNSLLFFSNAQYRERLFRGLSPLSRVLHPTASRISAYPPPRYIRISTLWNGTGISGMTLETRASAGSSAYRVACLFFARC